MAALGMLSGVAWGCMVIRVRGEILQPRRLAPGWRILRGSAVFVGSAIGTVLGVGVITVAEGFVARERLMPTRQGSVVPRTGVFGGDLPGEPVRLALMGDSLAVGYGVDDGDRTPGVLLAGELVASSGRPVILSNVAEVGAEATGLIVQLSKLRASGLPDVAVIIIGANDVMHLRRLTDALRPLSETVHELRRLGVRVVVATCPDLGTVRPFAQPLRFFAHWMGRVLATSQTIVVLRAGGRTVSLADTLGELFRKDPTEMFSTLDHLHPSERGYESAAAVMAPSVRVAAGFPLPSDTRVPHRVYRKGSQHPLAWWAFRASRRVGVQLSAVDSAVAADRAALDGDAAAAKSA